MGKYSSSSRASSKPTRPKVHPLMRGIGCITMVLVPILSFGIAAFLTSASGPARAWRLPPSWFGPPNIPSWLNSLQGLRPITGFLAQQQNLTGNLIIGGLIAIVLFGLMSIIYGFMYNIMAPSKYGPTDVPPPRVKTKKYTR